MAKISKRAKGEKARDSFYSVKDVLPGKRGVTLRFENRKYELSISLSASEIRELLRQTKETLT